jgi:hypothetical protein
MAPHERGICHKTQYQTFPDDGDRTAFLERLAPLVAHSGAALYAWALIPNHFHQG